MQNQKQLNRQVKNCNAIIDELLTGTKVTPESFGSFTEKDQEIFTRILEQRILEVSNLHTKLLAIMGEVSQLSVNRMAWENNHVKITRAIQSSLQKNGVMPNHTQLAQLTGLSRQTIIKHLSENADISVNNEYLHNFSMMAPQVLNKVLQGALGSSSNIAAMKLYFQLLEKMNGQNAMPLFSQNNYIQINNTVFKQETLQHLSPEQLKQIEELLQRCLPQPAALNEK